MNKISDYPYPLNLYRDLCDRLGKPFPEEITDDQLKGLNTLMEGIPNERYRGILLQRYVMGKTYPEIGEQNGITGSRIGQMKQNILNKIAKSSLSGMLMGYDEFLATNTIDVLDLSTRVERAFLRNDINTLEDIKYHGYSNIKNLRNVGVDTLTEIMEKTWFLWSEKEREQEKKLSPRHKKNLETILAKNGLSSKKIKEIINFIEINVDAE
jgi:hypothetical protein